ncbi:MAG TPA: hypothetical protein VG778_09035, partial [Blastocatellia bacterium]|nr:hypothetical protein [Blastocatellia bacterium]
MSAGSPTHYTDPETVLSPKGSVANLRVLLNTGENGWAVASLQWDGRDALGIRWNGHPKNPIGNPQSRGIATWFILPDELAAILRSRFGDALTGLNDQNADITRVRIRPLPHRIWKGTPQEPADYEWVLSITDRVQGHMEIMNPGTGHFMAVHRSQVKGLVRDTGTDRPNGPKHGILNLNVQMVFEDGRLTLEPLQSLTDRVEALSHDMRRTGYEGQHDRVRALIQEARQTLVRPTGAIGPW